MYSALFRRCDFNVFVLSKDAKECAQFHCDAHVRKMVIEYAQLMSEAHFILDEVGHEQDARFCKPFNPNHPRSKWVRESRKNYEWLYKLWVELNWEYVSRFGKENAIYRRCVDVLISPPESLEDNGFTRPALAMPDHIKMTSVIDSYRYYYVSEKDRLLKYTNASEPKWIAEIRKELGK